MGAIFYTYKCVKYCIQLCQCHKYLYLKVIEEVLLLCLKQLPVGGVPQRLVPETADIDSGHLRVPKKYFEFYKK